MKKTVILLAALCFGFFTQAQKVKEKDIIGTWKLVIDIEEEMEDEEEDERESLPKVTSTLSPTDKLPSEDEEEEEESYKLPPTTSIASTSSKEEILESLKNSLSSLNKALDAEKETNKYIREDQATLAQVRIELNEEKEKNQRAENVIREKEDKY